MKNYYFLAFVPFLLLALTINAQETFPPSQIIEGTFIGKTGRLDQFQTIDPSEVPAVPTMIIDQIVTEVPKGEENQQNTPTNFFSLQTDPGQIQSMPIEQNFIGANQSESGFLPPDPTGAAGPDHYLHSVNSIVKIFDKTGNLLVGPVSLSNFLGIASNNGDPIVLYDQLAERWFVSEFGNLGGNLGLAVGVSETSDPAGAYNVYQFDMGGFPDYPKYGIWHDGYYGTANYIGSPQTVAAFVMERDVILAGGPSPQLILWESLPGNIENTQQVRSGEPVNLIGTTIDPSTPGYFVYLQDDGWPGPIQNDHIKVWEAQVDWVNTANSTISAPLEIPTDPFDAGELFGNGNGAIRQPGTSQRLAGHGGIVSFGANYRSFGTHNSWLITFNTFIDQNETGGIRWIELRNDGVNDWSIYQEGTYAIADGHSRVMSSAAMDAAGNIAMGYTTASTTLPVSLRITGRYDGDPLGTMTVAEQVIFDGPGVRTNTYRYGDYSQMTIDPDNFTFWFTSDYFSANNVWETRVASFTLSSGFAADVGVNNILQPENGVLTNAETVEISIRNFGTETQSNIPVELKLDGNVVANEVFGGSVAGGDVATYTFTQTVDLSNVGQTYTLEAKTNLPGDEFTPNDDYAKEVTHLFANDVGPIELVAPSSGSGLGTQTVSVLLKNFGASTQSNFDVQYTINGGAPVVETFTGSLASEEETVFNFATQGDFSEIGTYEVIVTTSLSGDQDTSNDEITVEVENFLCQPEMDCSFGDGFQLFSVAEIDNPSGCEGYGDFTNQVAFFEPDTTYDLTVTTGYGDQYVTVWIDFNDDYSFTNDEKVVDNYVIAPGQGSGTFTETFDLVVPAGVPPGDHIMRAKTNWQAPVPADACEETTYGETEDYTANTGVLGIEDRVIGNANFVIISHGGNKFEAILETEYEEGVYLSVFNLLGQEIGFNKGVPKINGAFRVNLDMSNLSSGVYLIRMGGQATKSFKTGRIIVE